MKIFIMSLLISMSIILSIASGIAETTTSTTPIGENNVNVQPAYEVKKRYDAQPTSHITAYLPLEHQRKYFKDAMNINEKMRKGLSKIHYLYLISKNDMNKYSGKKWRIPRCSSKHCANTIGDELESHRVIFGDVKIYEKKYYNELGESGADQYLLGLKNPKSYVITISLLRLQDKKVLITIKEKTNRKNLNKTIEKILKKIKKYYDKRPLPIIIEKKLVENKVEPIIKEENKPEIKKKAKPIFSLNTAGTLIIPFYTFNNYSDIGGGFTVTPEVRNLFQENWVFQFSTSYYYFQNKKSKIEHLHGVQLSLLSGYTFPIPFKKVSALDAKYLITPLIGIGYNILIVNESDGGFKHYADPFLTLQCQFDFKVYDKMYVFITPGINFIIESTQMGMNANFNIGYKVSF